MDGHSDTLVARIGGGAPVSVAEGSRGDPVQWQEALQSKVGRPPRAVFRFNLLVALILFWLLFLLSVALPILTSPHSLVAELSAA